MGELGDFANQELGGFAKLSLVIHATPRAALSSYSAELESSLGAGFSKYGSTVPWSLIVIGWP